MKLLDLSTPEVTVFLAEADRLMKEFSRSSLRRNRLRPALHPDLDWRPVSWCLLLPRSHEWRHSQSCHLESSGSKWQAW